MDNVILQLEIFIDSQILNSDSERIEVYVDNITKEVFQEIWIKYKKAGWNKVLLIDNKIILE